VIQADKKDASDGVKKQLGIIETLIKIIRTKGPASLYRGFLANMANTFIQRTYTCSDGRIRLLLLVHTGPFRVY